MILYYDSLARNMCNNRNNFTFIGTAQVTAQTLVCQLKTKNLPKRSIYITSMSISIVKYTHRDTDIAHVFKLK